MRREARHEDAPGVMQEHRGQEELLPKGYDMNTAGPFSDQQRSTKTVAVRFSPALGDDFAIDEHVGADGFAPANSGALIVTAGEDVRAVYARGSWLSASVTDEPKRCARCGCRGERA